MSKLKQFFTRDKLTAFGIHLGLSLLIFLSLLFVILNYWYPSPLFTTDGGWQVLRIVVLVDVVLGPLLTLVVYRKGKPRLKLDMALIILLQVGALAGGGWVTWKERPLFVALVDKELVPAPASLYVPPGNGTELLDQFGERNTRIVRVDLPEDLAARSEVLSRAMRAARPLYTFPDLLVRPTLTDFQRAALSLEELEGRDAKAAAEVARFRARHPDAEQHFVFLPMRSRFALWVGVVDRDSLQLVDVLDIPVTAEL